MIRNLFVSIILLHQVAAQPDFPLGSTGATGPLVTVYSKVLAAAEAARDAYHAPADLMVARKEAAGGGSAPEVGVLFTETDERCTAAFVGGSVGFEWVSDIDMRRNYVSVRDRPKRRCRVVKHYKTLYFNTRYEQSYKEELDGKLDACWGAGKEVIFAGHDLGGALATLAALEYARFDLWSITFGQPPVFMPAKYKDPLQLGGSPGSKHPCKAIDMATYVPIINTEYDSTPRLKYDFMAFLNVLLYGVADGATPSLAAECLQQGGQAVLDFWASDEVGNLGSQFGRSYLLAPSEALDSTGLRYLSQIPEPGKRNRVWFRNQGNNGVVYDYLLVDELVAAGADCQFSTYPVHDMETYLSKIVSYESTLPIPIIIDSGFNANNLCNVDTDCQSTCGKVGFEGICDAAGARPPNMGIMKITPMK